MRRERPETRLLCFARRADRHDRRSAVGATTALRFTEPAPHRLAWQVERDGRVVGAQRLPAGVRIEAELAHTAAPLVHAFGRLARTIARRRVGVALSGGGAWGFAHCALLHGLAARGIPVDVIAGASFGSVVGAFHAAGALAALIEQAPRMARMARWCSLSTAPIERFIEHQLGDRSIEDLEITFLPVAVDVVAAREIVITRGSVAAGVRASCAFPGAWGPVVVGGARYVDGCVTSNVPVAAVADAGADLVIASCVMRPPSPRPPAPPRSRLARWWAPLSPRRRAHDLQRAIRLWAYTASCRQAADADLAFVPDLAPFRITEFAAASRIIARAAAQLGPLLDAASTRYAALEHRTV
jgi:NTE family protein